MVLILAPSVQSGLCKFRKLRLYKFCYVFQSSICILTNSCLVNGALGFYRNSFISLIDKFYCLICPENFRGQLVNASLYYGFKLKFEGLTVGELCIFDGSFIG